MEKMKEFFKKVNVFNGIISLLLISLGICFVCVPSSTILTLCYIFGAFIMFFGICGIVSYFFYGLEPFGFMNGICELVVGTLIFAFAPQITSPQVFSVLVGVVLLFSGLVKMQNSMDYRRFGLKNWWLYMIYAATMVVASIVLMAYPFAGQKIALIFLGIVLIYDGIMKLVSMFVFKGKVNRFKKKLNEDVIIIDKDENDSQNGENK